MENKTSLEELRKAIDDIDSHIFSLLEERAKIVDMVGAHKSLVNPDSSIIRPGREAVMVREVFKKAVSKGYNEKIALAFAVLWRNIISLSINLEEHTDISVFPSDAGIASLARDYFGIFSNVSHKDSSEDAVNSILSGDSNIGVFGIEEKAGDVPWWKIVADNNDKISVFAGLPFFEKDKPLSALVVARVKSEPTGKDKFVYVIEGDIPEDQSDNFEVIASHGISKLCLIDEFYNEYNTKLKGRYIGCFAIF